MNLEVQVRIPVRVSGVPVPRDLLARRDLRAVRNREGDVLDAAATVVVLRGEVVVQVDVHVHRPAAAVEVEHAAAETRVRVRDLPGLDRDDGRTPRVLHVDPCMAVRPARVAVVVPEVGLRDEREDEPRDTRAAARFGASRGHDEHSGQKSGEEWEENPSGCRPVASHVTVVLRFALEGRDASRG